MVYASDLQTLSPYNVIIKYADDTTLLVGQHSSVDIQQEYDNICSWSAGNRLTINSYIKLKKLFFIGLPQDILIFRLFCQTLNELHRLHYLDLISRPPFLLLYM